jgi:small subunit ribosomal protein S20
MRSSARKRTQNASSKSRLHTLEKKFLTLVSEGKKDDALQALRATSSAYDKAVKTGVVHKATADRKKSRLNIRFNGLK